MDKNIFKRINETLDKTIEYKKNRKNELENIENSKKEFVSTVSQELVSLILPLMRDFVEIGRMNKLEMLNAVRNIKVNTEIKAPDVNIPEIKLPNINIPDVNVNIPEIKVPKAIVNVTLPEIKVPKVVVPEIKLPEINIPEIKMPDEMNVRGWVQLQGVTLDNPLPVQLRDADGKPVKFPDSINVSGGGGGGGYKEPKKATTKTVYNVTMTLADTQYSQILPENVMQLQFRCRGLYDVRHSFDTGIVATPTTSYETLKAGMTGHEDKLNLNGKTLYFACGTAGQVLEIAAWT